MSTSPYNDLPPDAFWRSAVTQAHPLSPESLYRKRFEIAREDRIGTAGSCFAQHISRAMRRAGFNVMDVEPAPKGLPRSNWQQFGYGLYSARYANIYTPRQLLQLLREAFQGANSPDPVWEKKGAYFDSMRPSVEPEGLATPDEVSEHRAFHLACVRRLIEEVDVFIFTLGLTECWEYRRTGWVFPTAPGTVAGIYDSGRYAFRNLTYGDVLGDMRSAIELIRAHNRSSHLRLLFTVSPVPLTATYADEHVVTATTYSKSVLRAVAGELCATDDRVAYFPSYEMVAAPWARGVFYDANLRTVNRAGVDIIMSAFLSRHLQRDVSVPDERSVSDPGTQPESVQADDVACEDALLDAFAGSAPTPTSSAA